MQIFQEIDGLKSFLKEKKAQQQSIGLVPTMGALHEGHLALVAASRSENQVTVVSIYVNPTQFNNPADLEKYPRHPEKDIAMLEKAGCDVLFYPNNEEMYPHPSKLKFDFGGLDKILEGEFRPGHFSGVALVVSKLFNIATPDKAYFGQKDFQQFMIISKLVEELNFGIELRCIATLRETDGLAMSSRNLRLNTEQREKATVFYKALTKAKGEILQGKNLTQVKIDVKSAINAVPGVSLEYFEVTDKENLIVLESVKGADQLVMVIAGFVGEIRLIDNMLIG